jgi:hypothetical protein
VVKIPLRWINRRFNDVTIQQHPKGFPGGVPLNTETSAVNLRVGDLERDRQKVDGEVMPAGRRMMRQTKKSLKKGPKRAKRGQKGPRLVAGLGKSAT